jgi:hypothetical protein
MRNITVSALAPRCAMRNITVSALFCFAFASTVSTNASPVIFSTGNPTGAMAVASRPGSATTSEIETADDFFLTGETLVSGATLPA